MARTLLGRLVARAAPALPDPLWPYVTTARSLRGSVTVGLPAWSRAVVVAAHPDDDVIGCGGTVAALAGAGCQVDVLYLANGDGTRGSALRPEQVAAARQTEAAAAARRLGAASTTFLGLSDHAVASRHDDATAAIAAALPGADAVLCPWFLDDHDDHVAAAACVLDAAPDDLPVWMYEIWTPLPPNRIVDVTATIEVKRAALADHATAGEAFDLDAALGLSRYRSMRWLRGHGYAEAFLAGSAAMLRAASASGRA